MNSSYSAIEETSNKLYAILKENNNKNTNKNTQSFFIGANGKYLSPFFLGDINNCKVLILGLNPRCDEPYDKNNKLKDFVVSDENKLQDYLNKYKEKYITNKNLKDIWNQWLNEEAYWEDRFAKYLENKEDKLTKTSLLEYYPFCSHNTPKFCKTVKIDNENFDNIFNKSKWMEFIKGIVKNAIDNNMNIIVHKMVWKWIIDEIIKDNNTTIDKLNIYGATNNQKIYLKNVYKFKTNWVKDKTEIININDLYK